MPGDGKRMRSDDRHRGRLRIGILFLLLAGVISALVVQNIDRTADSDAVITATVRQLWLSPEIYEGKQVATSGIVRVFLAGSPKEHFVVEQVGHHRVGLQGVDRARLVSLLGAEVTVKGVLRIDEEVGIYIHVEHLTPTTGHTNAGTVVSRQPLRGGDRASLVAPAPTTPSAARAASAVQTG